MAKEKIEQADPVAVKAAKEAVAETNPRPPSHPWFNRFLIVLAVFLVFAGTSGAILGAINSLSVSHANKALTEQNVLLKQQQTCIIRLVANFKAEQDARVEISTDDRLVVDRMVKAVRDAKSQEDIAKAFSVYNKERNANEKKRSKLPQIGSPVECLNLISSSPTAFSISPSSSPSKSAAKKSKKPVSAPKPAIVSTSTASNGVVVVTRSQTLTARRNNGSTVTRVVVIKTTSQAPKPVPSVSSKAAPVLGPICTLSPVDLPLGC